jgi:hypothetical protein
VSDPAFWQHATVPAPPDHMMLRAEEVIRVIGTAMKFPTTGTAIIPPGIDLEEQNYPALYVEPEDLLPSMQTTHRFVLDGVLWAGMFFVGDDRERLVNLASQAVAGCLKLFGNNALDDLNTAGYTTKWKSNPTILGGITDNAAWYDSDMKFNYSRSGRLGTRNGERLIRLALMRFTFHAAVVL